jgi:hypothetical protein
MQIILHPCKCASITSEILIFEEGFRFDTAASLQGQFAYKRSSSCIIQIFPVYLSEEEKVESWKKGVDRLTLLLIMSCS